MNRTVRWSLLGAIALLLVGAVGVWRLRAEEPPSARFCTAAGVFGPVSSVSPEDAFERWWADTGPSGAMAALIAVDADQGVDPPSRSDFDRESEARWFWETGAGGVQVDVYRAEGGGWQVGGVNACGPGDPG